MTGPFKDDNDRLRAGQLPTDHRAGTKVAADAGWPELIPLARPDVPPFPTAVLPAWQRELVEAAALETETEVDLGALAVLSAQATAVQRKLHVEQRPGFIQPLCLWTLSLLKSGGRKSRVFNLATTPLEDWQLRKAHEMRGQIASRASEKRRLEQRLKRSEKAAAEARTADQQRTEAVGADELSRQLAEFETTQAPVLFVTEATPERIEELLVENGERMGVLSDENGMLELLSGRYSRAQPNLSALNAAHDAGRVRVGRKRREDGSGGDRMLEHAVVTFGLSVQPDRLFSVLRENSAFFDSGFAWRFLYALVPSTLGDRTHRTPTTPQQVQETYGEHLTQLLNLPAPAWNDIPVIRLAPEAAESLLHWEAKLQEPRLSEGGELARLESWGSKLASRLCRIAGLFHAAEHPLNPSEFPLALQTMERALRLADYFIPHVKAVAFDLRADPNLDLARTALAWIRRGRCLRFRRRDLHKATANNEPADTVDGALAVLQERGFVRELVQAPEGRGRPPIEFLVNPAALG